MGKRNPCAAHRGWSGRAPENTLAAIGLALSDPDIEWIEIDVQLSKDHVPVVFHDYKLRRTTNGKGKVNDWTAAELALLDAGSWFSPLYRNERIPTLDSVFQAAKGKCRLNVELKTDGVRYPLIEEQVLQLIQHWELEGDVVITSFHAGALKNMNRLSGGTVRTGYIVDKWRESLPAELADTGSDFISIEYGKLDKDRVAKLHAGGIQIMAWTVNEERAIRKVMALDPDIIICTNYPERWHSATAADQR